jgi:hypothetical protein
MPDNRPNVMSYFVTLQSPTDGAQTFWVRARDEGAAAIQAQRCAGGHHPVLEVRAKD